MHNEVGMFQKSRCHHHTRAGSVSLESPRAAFMSCCRQAWHTCACRELLNENEALREELSAFTPEFWDELEELKHELCQAQQLCGKYERQLGIRRSGSH